MIYVDDPYDTTIISGTMSLSLWCSIGVSVIAELLQLAETKEAVNWKPLV